jgi:hypothetical protein
MKLFKMAFVMILSAGLFSGPAFAVDSGSLNGRTKVYSPEVEASKASVAGFVIAVRGSLTATNDAGQVRELTRRSKFYANETLKTENNARAQLRFKDRALMTLKPGTELNIGDYHFGGAKDPENQSFMTLVSGGFRTISGAIGKLNKSAYRIETPAASIGIRGTDYELVISVDGKLFAAVHDGGISLVNDLGELDLGSNSNYIFAVVGQGEIPSGLDEVPEIFVIQDGEKQALTDEQKEAIAQFIEENDDFGEVFEALASGVDTENPEKTAIDELREPEDVTISAVDDRLSDAEKALLANGRFAILVTENGEGQVPDFNAGKSAVVSATGDRLYQDSQTGEVLKYQRIPITDETGVAEPTGSMNIDWGTWDQAELVLTGDLSETVFNKAHWMDAVPYDLSAISERQGIVTLGLGNLVGGTTSPNHEIKRGLATGLATLNFTNKTVDGAIEGISLYDMTDQQSPVQIGTLQFAFQGDMIKNGELNNNFQIGTVDSLSYITQFDSGAVTAGSVAGVIVEPEVAGGDPAFAGSFEAELPGAAIAGNDFAIQGLFTMVPSGGLRPAAKPDFLR